jgi:hypothetical protein
MGDICITIIFISWLVFIYKLIKSEKDEKTEK